MKRMAIVSFQRGVESPPPVRQRAALFLGRTGAVGQVVGDAHEGVQGAHGPPLVGGQQAEGVVEVAGLATGQPFAVGVGACQG